MCWMPRIVLLVDKLLAAAPWAWAGLIVAWACQLLIGAVEPVVHTVYVAALLMTCRLAKMAWRKRWRVVLGRVLVAGVCGIAAVLLASPQLLPAVELTRLSPRAPGSLTLAQVLYPGSLPPATFLPAALEAIGIVTVGVLPLLAIPLVIGWRRNLL